MKSSFRWIIGLIVLLVVAMGAFSGGFVAGWLTPRQVFSQALSNPAPSAGAQSTLTPQEKDDLFQPFWEAWDIVNKQYVDQPLDPQKLMRGAIRGMIGALDDEHSSFMDPDEYRQANLPMDGEYEGIGAWVDITGEFLKIIGPMPGSPAEKAGLKPGDVVIKVDGEDMTGIDGNLVLRRILGPAGSKVTLTIAREGETQPFDVTIERANIEVPSVESRMLDDGIGYIHLLTYGEKTNAELKTALRDLLRENPKGLVLDLRNNGGGYLVTAIDVTSQFLKEGLVMDEVYGDGTRKHFEVKPGGMATEIPLVVLVNGGTASASEITAGALQDSGRATLVGETTYGKGSVQNWVPLSDDEGAVRVTIARWETPKGRQIHKVGLTPDVVVPLTEEDMKAEKDPQLDKAVELLNK